MPDKWKPEVKVAAAAVATLTVWVVSSITGVDVPLGVEGAIATIVAYLIPSG